MDAVGAVSPASAPAPQAGERSHIWAKKEFSFHDLLDVINPLQHLPVIGTVYRWVTGDEIGNLPRLAGDFLFGGPIGLAFGAVSTAVKELSGKDPGEHVIALLTDQSAAPGTGPATTAVASAAAPTAGAPAPPVAVPDHPPMPLARPVVAFAPATASATPVPSARPVAAPGAATAGAAMMPGAVIADSSTPPGAAQAFLQQRDAATRRFAAGPAPRNMPVPLQLSGAVHPQPKAAPKQQDDDFSQRMMAALDRYARLRPEQGDRPGSVVDLSH
jgi:hypothetical protein